MPLEKTNKVQLNFSYWERKSLPILNHLSKITTSWGTFFATHLQTYQFKFEKKIYLDRIQKGAE